MALWTSGFTIEASSTPSWRSLAFGLALAATCFAPSTVFGCTGLAPGPARTVTQILDAETVRLDDGSELRLIGALGPRALDVGAEPGQWPAEVTARAELQALLLGRSLELAFDGERTDRYGRWQAQAFWVDNGTRRWVQGHLLEQGLARAYTQPGNRACGEALLAAEAGARQAGRGLWADAAYRVRSAQDTAELLGLLSTFQVVEGRITRAARTRNAVFLNFGAYGGFSAVVRAGDIGLLGADANNPKALPGRRVRVRGWIERRRGPAIDVSAAGIMERLDPPTPIASPPRSGEPAKPAAHGAALIETGR